MDDNRIYIGHDGPKCRQKSTEVWIDLSDRQGERPPFSFLELAWAWLFNTSIWIYDILALYAQWIWGKVEPVVQFSVRYTVRISRWFYEVAVVTIEHPATHWIAKAVGIVIAIPFVLPLAISALFSAIAAAVGGLIPGIVVFFGVAWISYRALFEWIAEFLA